jgi:uncharacterized membrane protein
MNAAQIHLALNHVPLLLSITGGAILVWGLIRNNESFKVLSLYLLVASALFTVPVFLTGEGTEELVEETAGVTGSAIGKHESMAKISLIIIIITGVVALGGLLMRRKTAIAKLFFAGALFFSLAGFGTMAQTAHLGGLIRHTELKSGIAEGNENSKEKNESEESKINKAVKDTLNETKGRSEKDDD